MRRWDRLASRATLGLAKGTIVGVGLAVIAGGLFLAVVLGLGGLTGIDEPTLELMAVATLVVALLFEPLRRRLTREANRLVYGQETTPWEAIGQLSAELSLQGDPAESLSALAELIASGTRADKVQISLLVEDEQAPIAGWPEGVTGLDPDFAVSIDQGGERLGTIVIEKAEALSETDRTLVSDLAAEAAIVTRAIRLTESLRQRIAHVRRQREALVTSRARTVAIQEDERRRLERDIHDTCQQQAVSLGARLGLAAAIAPRDPDTAEAALQDAENDLRRLQNSLLRLTIGDSLQQSPDGLGAALRAQSARLPIPVTIWDRTRQRHDAELESDVYYCCSEAIQNAIKHSRATRIEVTIAETPGSLLFSVADDGCGFEPQSTSAGQGLANMRGRVGRWGGNLSVDSSSTGTKVRGSIPLPHDGAEL